MVRWKIVGVTVHSDTLVPIARQQVYARLAKMANRAKMEVLQRVVVCWQIVGAVVRQGTRGTTVKRQILARLEAMARHAKMEVL